MKKKLFLFIICLNLFANIAFSQIDNSERTVNIKAIDTTADENQSASLKLDNSVILKESDEAPDDSSIILEDPFKESAGVDMTAKSDLVKPTWNIKQTFKEQPKKTSKFSRDQNLGYLETTSKYVTINCRDHEYVDGDRIRLMLNNAVIHPNITLYGTYYSIEIELQEGMNLIHFVALNEGSSSPNTAQLKVVDENSNLLSSNKWLINTGYKASLSVLKQ